MVGYPVQVVMVLVICRMSRCNMTLTCIDNLNAMRATLTQLAWKACEILHGVEWELHWLRIVT